MQAVALRLFNGYGAGQAVSNPYTGVLAIFASRLLNGERPMVFEDGAQRLAGGGLDGAEFVLEIDLLGQGGAQVLVVVDDEDGLAVGLGCRHGGTHAEGAVGGRERLSPM